MKPIVIIANKKPIQSVYVVSKPPIVSYAQQILRGEKGATDITPIAPLKLNNTDELYLDFHIHQQSVASDNWLINHGLNKRYPSLYIFDDLGNQIVGNIQPIDEMSLVVAFLKPVTGTADLR